MWISPAGRLCRVPAGIAALAPSCTAAQEHSGSPCKEPEPVSASGRLDRCRRCSAGRCSDPPPISYLHNHPSPNETRSPSFADCCTLSLCKVGTPVCTVGCTPADIKDQIDAHATKPRLLTRLFKDFSVLNFTCLLTV